MGMATMTLWTPAAWLAAGAALGIAAALLIHRLRSWREARIAAEWDPY